MSETTGIAWTEKTWNPWHGCTKVSPGCAHCYMYREKERYGQNPEIVVRSKTKFRDPLKWKYPALVFTCSWSDWFHEAADEWRDEAWEIVKATPHLTYQILTKRPERIMAHLPKDWDALAYQNVWLGVSVENQRWTSRIEELARVNCLTKFVSAEPLLGPLDLTVELDQNGWPEDSILLDVVEWVIVGGESGKEQREMKLDWARKIRDDCSYHEKSFFLKQLGGHPDARAHDKAILDGRTHTEIPR